MERSMGAGNADRRYGLFRCRGACVGDCGGWPFPENSWPWREAPA